MTKQSITKSLRFPALLILLIWVIHIIKVGLDLPWNAWGILPRSVTGIRGILTAPLLHGDFGHLIGNSLPLIVLTTMLFLFYKKVALKSFMMIYILTGLAVWLFARHVYHIGASGVVYGLISFVFWSGIFRRNLRSIVLALIVTILYSGYFMGIAPNQRGISWESHLFGAIVGIIVAYLLRNEIEPEDEDESTEEVSEHYYFERDIFDR